MKTVFCAAGQALAIALLALGVGLSANAFAGKDRVNLGRDYRPSHPPPVPPKTPPGDDPNAGAAIGPTSEQPFQIVTLAEAKAIFDDPRTETGGHVFVDVRPDAPFSSGHIPGAIQCDYYRLEAYMTTVLQHVGGAEKIVVYCNGGTCDDSLAMCSELWNNHGLPWGRIFLFKGGWEEWHGAGYPAETGQGGNE